MKKLGLLIVICIACPTAVTVGCAWPFYKIDETIESQPTDSKWFYQGHSTGVDPRAKEIERRLGYE